MGGRGYGGGGRGRVYSYRYTVTTRMACIKMGSDESYFNVFINCEGQSHKTVSTNHNFWRERRSEAVSNRGPSAYQPTARPNRFSERQADRGGIPVVRLRTEGPNAFKGPTVSKIPAVAYMSNDWSQTTIDSFYQSSGDSGHASSR